MNSNVNFSTPSFGAKVYLAEVADKLKRKNPDGIKKYLETMTKDYPKDVFCIQDNGKDGICMTLTAGKGLAERTLELPAKEFKRLLRTTKSNIEQTFGVACETLKGAVEMDAETSKKLDKAIKNGQIIEGSLAQDVFVANSDREVEKFVKCMTEDEELLSKAKFM